MEQDTSGKYPYSMSSHARVHWHSHLLFRHTHNTALPSKQASYIIYEWTVWVDMTVTPLGHTTLLYPPHPPDIVTNKAASKVSHPSLQTYISYPTQYLPLSTLLSLSPVCPSIFLFTFFVVLFKMFMLFHVYILYVYLSLSSYIPSYHLPFFPFLFHSCLLSSLLPLSLLHIFPILFLHFIFFAIVFYFFFFPRLEKSFRAKSRSNSDGTSWL